MTFYTASFETVVLRFSLMMAVIIAPFFIGIPELAIIALPIFLAAMTAVSFEHKAKAQEAVISTMQSNKQLDKAA